LKNDAIRRTHEYFIDQRTRILVIARSALAFLGLKVDSNHGICHKHVLGLGLGLLSCQERIVKFVFYQLVKVHHFSFQDVKQQNLFQRDFARNDAGRGKEFLESLVGGSEQGEFFLWIVEFGDKLRIYQRGTEDSEFGSVANILRNRSLLGRLSRWFLGGILGGFFRWFLGGFLGGILGGFFRWSLGGCLRWSLGGCLRWFLGGCFRWTPSGFLGGGLGGRRWGFVGVRRREKYAVDVKNVAIDRIVGERIDFRTYALVVARSALAFLGDKGSVGIQDGSHKDIPGLGLGSFSREECIVKVIVDQLVEA